MGKVNEETIYLNEETIWYGRDLDRKNPDTGKYLDQIRELLFAGEVEKAQFLAKIGDHIDSQIYESVSAGGRFKDLYVSSQRKGRTV